MSKTIDDCYLIWGEGGLLQCTYNHKAGEKCLALLCQYCNSLDCVCYKDKDNEATKELQEYIIRR